MPYTFVLTFTVRRTWKENYYGSRNDLLYKTCIRKSTIQNWIYWPVNKCERQKNANSQKTKNSGLTFTNLGRNWYIIEKLLHIGDFFVVYCRYQRRTILCISMMRSIWYRIRKKGSRNDTGNLQIKVRYFRQGQAVWINNNLNGL